MSYQAYINTDRIQQFDLSTYHWDSQWVEEGGNVLLCEDHTIILLENDLYTGGVMFGCEKCGYREVWLPG